MNKIINHCRFTIMATHQRRINYFFELVQQKYGEEQQVDLKDIWAEVCKYRKCVVMVKNGKRKGEECGKACVTG